jgi:two-component system, cell cycle response regulator
VLDAQRTLRDLPTVLPSTRPTLHTEAKFVLVVMNGAQIGERRAVDHVIGLGRDPASDLSVRDATVSWSHAKIRVENGELWLDDLASKHGTWVGGQRVSGSVRLKEGDDIEVGVTRLRVELHGPAELLFDRAVVDRLERDDITGLLTRRKFDAELEGSIEAAQKSSAELTLVVLDLDGLKRVNDAHGHACGAEVIRIVGEALRDRIPHGGHGCRFGGDEFAVVAPGVSEAFGAILAQTLIAAASSADIRWEGAKVNITASAGVADLTNVSSVTELFTRADRALFAAKRRGGNQVVRWSALANKTK